MKRCCYCGMKDQPPLPTLFAEHMIKCRARAFTQFVAAGVATLNLSEEANYDFDALTIVRMAKAVCTAMEEQKDE